MTIYIGKNIKFLRVKNDITQDKIGDWIGKSGKTVSSYESSGAEPNIKALAIFSEKFGVTVDALLFKDIEKGNRSEKTYEIPETPSAIHDPPPQYGGVRGGYEVKEIYVEKKCDLTGAACAFARVPELEEENRQLRARLEELEKRK